MVEKNLAISKLSTGRNKGFPGILRIRQVLGFTLLLFLFLFGTCSGGESGTGDGTDSVSLTFAAYNVEDFGNSGASDTYRKVAGFARDEGVDVLALQEVQPGDHAANSSEWNYPANDGDAEDFAEALATAGVDMPHYVFSDNGGGWNGVYGDYLACWSQLVIASSKSFLQGTYTDPVSGTSFDCSALRPALYCELRLDQETSIHVYVLHLKAQGFPPGDTPDDIKKRRAQAAAFEAYILANHDPEKERIIILGDMNTALTADDGHSGNDFADNSTLGLLCLKSDNPGNTANDFVSINIQELAATNWTHSVYESRLDHIILSPAARAAFTGEVAVVQHPVNDPSDHYPVVTTLRF